MASDSADQALSPDVISFVICGKTWRLGDPIHSTGFGAVEKKKMVQTFGEQAATARAEGVSMGRGTGQKYRVKWTNLSEELICEYGANHRLFQDPSKERPQKAPKSHGPQPLSLDTAGSGLAVSNMADASELYPSSAEDSEPDLEDPQVPGISPLQIGDNVWRMAPSLHLHPSRLGLLLAIHIPKLRYPQHFSAGIESSDLRCVQFFKQDDLISLLLLHTNAGIAIHAEQISKMR